MVIAVESLLGLAAVLVAASFAGVLLGRVSRGALVIAAAFLVAAAALAGGLFVAALAASLWDWEPLLVSFAGLVAAAIAEGGAVGLQQGLRTFRSLETMQTRAVERLDDTLATAAETRARELERTLVRERAETLHLISQQERALRAERLAESDQAAREAENRLTETITSAQTRLEHRLSSWSADLERAQQQLKLRLEELIRRQAEALEAHQQRLADHARDVEGLEELQQSAIARVRSELERQLADVTEQASVELEAHAAERRRALHEVGERLRSRERAMREQIERAASEVRGQLSQVAEEVERRHLEQLERLLDRAVLRLSEDAERRFDQQLRDSREQTAERLERELELSMEMFTRSAEKEVAARIAEAAQASAARLQRQVDDVVRAAEAQTGISNERIRGLSERLERSLEAAELRLNAFEEQIELELTAKLAEIERALRSAEQLLDRERRELQSG